MASTRINIIKSQSFGPQCGIDRTMPAIMKRRMGAHEWEHFCNQVDNIMEPLNKGKYEDVAVMIGFCLVFSSFVTIIIVSPFLYLLFIPFVLMICTCGLIGRAASKRKAVSEQLRRFCEETSRTNDEISFHLREEVIRGSDSTYREIYFIEACLRTIDVIVVSGNNCTSQGIDWETSKQFSEVEHSMTILPFVQAINLDEEGTPARERQADDLDVEKDLEPASRIV
ncbi:hypothetical protein IV203_031478 [Nitzschia inconspicua]|uniref:Uncharacterized protein n=1 Tax=Nitzschia inconspicua TaxID=303405 RepID=A0A9K3LUE3_9STRA|nr:hypothetical protein IV203_031478 [Nitzschia inconspicua]